MKFPFRSLCIGAVFCAFFAYLATVAVNRAGLCIPSTQISSFSFLLGFVLVLLLNPICRLLRLRVFSRAEIFLVFIMATVPASLPGYGYLCEVLPCSGALNHPAWNTPQKRWDEIVEPIVDDSLFIGAPLLRERDVKDWRAFLAKLAAGEGASARTPAARIWEMLTGSVRDRVRLGAQGKDYSDRELADTLSARLEAKKNKAKSGAAGVELSDCERQFVIDDLSRGGRYEIVRGMINTVLTDRNFYQEEYFKGVQLPDEALELLQRPRDSLSPERVQRLNRMALEASFPDDILPGKFLADQQACIDYANGLRAKDQESYPVFLKKKEESFAEFGSRFGRWYNRKPELDAGEVINWLVLYKTLADSSQPDAPAARARIWSLLPERLQGEVAELAGRIRAFQKMDCIPTSSVTLALRGLCERRDFYLKDAFAGLQLSSRYAKIAEAGLDSASDDDVIAFNREVLRLAVGDKAFSDWTRFSALLSTVSEATVPQWLRGIFPDLEEGGGERPLQAAVLRRVEELLPAGVRQTAVFTSEALQVDAALRPQLVAEFNQLLQRKDVYETAAFADAAPDPEVGALVKKGISSLAPDELAGLNRMLLEAAFRGGLQRYNVSFWGDTPWHSWLRPAGSWIVICLVFVLFFYSLNELVFRQWYEREKLVFPIAQFSDAVLSTKAEEGGSCVPADFKSAFFWVGFALAFFVLFYNGTVNARWLNLSPIDTNGVLDSYFTGTILNGLGPGFAFEIFFTAIGLAFLLPTEISFSVWFFYLLMMTEQLVAVWLGYGENGASFEANFYSVGNFKTMQGGGAMLVFGLVYLWRVRRQVTAVFYRFARPGGSGDFGPEEVNRYSFPSFLFFAASAAVLYGLCRGGVPIFMALFSYGVILVATVALVRVVAECGIVGFQAWCGPFHLIRMLGLFKYTALFAAKGVGTVMLMLAGFFLDAKAFIAPTMMNAKYLSEKNGVRRGVFALGVTVSVLVTLTVSIMVALAMTYDFGVTSMEEWFYQSVPQDIFNTTVTIVTGVDQYAAVDQSYAIPFGIGAVLCGLMMYLRQWLFWVPHPIGLVMFVNPKMRGFWFSFFVAWLCKRAAVKYCNTDGYRAVRAFFIGLIVGEILVVCLSIILVVFTGQNMGVSLDHN